MDNYINTERACRIQRLFYKNLINAKLGILNNGDSFISNGKSIMIIYGIYSDTEILKQVKIFMGLL